MQVRSQRIFIRNFALPVSIGIHEFERAAPQTVLFNIEIEVAATLPASRDDIASVLDYDFVRDQIRTLTKGRHFNLQETLCREILGLFNDRPEIRRVRLSSEKPDVYADCGAVGYEIECTFDG